MPGVVPVQKSGKKVADLLTGRSLSRTVRALLSGAIAQLGEHLHGMQGVGGSIPPSSTRFTGSLPDRSESGIQ